MLIPAKHIQHASTLSITEVCEAMKRSGYNVGRGEITGADFKGMSESGSFVYSITGPDPEGDSPDGDDDITLGCVYLRFQRRPFSTEFELHGDY